MSRRGHHHDRDEHRLRRRSLETRLTEAVLPTVLAGAVIAGGWIGNVAWIRHGTIKSAAGATLGSAVVAACLVWLTWHYAKPRGELIRVHATATTVACSVMFLVSLTYGLHRPWFPDMAGFAVALIGLSWMIPKFGTIRGEGKDTHPPEATGGWADIAAKARPTSTKVGDNHTTVKVRTQDGATIPDLQKDADKMAAMVGAPPGGVRVDPDPDRAGHGTVTFSHRDILKSTVPWPGPAHVGESISEPIPLGVWETGTVVEYWRPGTQVDPIRSATHFVVGGMSGAAKTGGALIDAAEVLTRVDAVEAWIDTAKYGQSAWPLAGAVCGISTENRARAFLTQLQRKVIPYRAKYLGDRRLQQWTPGCGLTYMVVHIEEAAGLMDVVPTIIVRLSEQLRSVGVSLTVSMQRPSGDNLPTSARSNLGGGICFGVRDDTDAGMVLSAETLAAVSGGPATWKNTKPGYFMIEAPGIPAEMWTVPARLYWDTDLPHTVHRILTDTRHVRATLDQGTQDALGGLWVIGTDGEPDTDDDIPPTPPVGDAMPTPVPDDDEYFDDDDRDALPRELTEGDGADYSEEELRRPLPVPAVDVNLAGDSSGREWTAEEKRATWQEILDDLRAEGAREVSTQRLVDEWMDKLGVPSATARPTLHRFLNEAIDQGLVMRDEERGRGWYLLTLDHAHAV